MRPEREERFAYALVSAAPLQDTNAAGIGIVFKAQDRSTLRTVCQALPDTDPLAAAYEAMMRVLEEALGTGVRRLTIYTDLADVVAQLTDDAPVPRGLLVAHLKTRGMINQLASVKFIAATSDRFSARLLAQSARLPGDGRPAPQPPPRGGRQLKLIAENASA
ncbi:MAG: reverse transcriptase-like protein [Armatimonadota bacterium]|jgi:ribonuclease HI